MVLTGRPGHSACQLRWMYRCGQLPMFHLPLAAGIFMLDGFSLSGVSRNWWDHAAIATAESGRPMGWNL